MIVLFKDFHTVMQCVLKSPRLGCEETRELKTKLDFFSTGISAAFKFEYIWNKEITVPKCWEKYFIERDPEFKEYLRLKEKFKDIQ